MTQLPRVAITGRPLWRFAPAATWLTVLAATALFAASLPFAFDDWRTVCVGAECPEGSLTPEAAARLADIGLGPSAYSAYLLALACAFAIACVVVAALILRARGREPGALIAAAMLALLGVAFPQTLLALADVGRVADAGVSALEGLALAALVLFAFAVPDGSLRPAWTRPVALGLIVVIAGERLATMPPVDSAGFPPEFDLALTVAAIGAIAIAQRQRYRLLYSAEQRQQVKWVLLGLAVALIGLVLVTLVEGLGATPVGSPADLAKQAAITAAFGALPLALAAAILRHRLWDIDVLVDRGLVYATLVVAVTAVYALVVGTLGAALNAHGTFAVSLAGAGAVAAAFQPLRARVERLVGRLLWGERDDPYALLSRLTARLEEAQEPEATLDSIVADVVGGLRLPFAAIAVHRAEGTEIAASYGEPVPEAQLTVLPLTYRGAKVGELRLAPRGRGEQLGRADLDLLRTIAHHAGLAAQAVRLTSDLRRSRQRLVAAREEERRRLRRDLHDGLGPALAGVALKLEAAGNRGYRSPDGDDSLLDELKDDAREAMRDVRRLVYGLRPPTLDELGLVGALRHRLSSSASELELELQLQQPLPPLPAATEVAAYRIAVEAFTNVVRHSGARRCLVKIAVGERLEVEVSDDGTGIPAAAPAGVGLASMRERVAELDGKIEIGRSHLGGTRVLAELPLEELG